MVYGVTATPHFRVGNTVVANNITARARLAVWQMAKALWLRQTITDGGAFEPGRVAFFGERRPGLNTLSGMWQWKKDSHHQRRFGPLGGLTCWARDLAEWPLEDIGHLTLDHIRSFWEPYGLAFQFNVEVKNIIRAGAYWNKGDYAFRLPDGKTIYAVRGKDRRGKDKDGQKHTTFDLLDNILDGRDDFPQRLHFGKRVDSHAEGRAGFHHRPWVFYLPVFRLGTPVVLATAPAYPLRTPY
jgi:hypothetical protein